LKIKIFYILTSLYLITLSINAVTKIFNFQETNAISVFDDFEKDGSENDEDCKYEMKKIDLFIDRNNKSKHYSISLKKQLAYFSENHYFYTYNKHIDNPPDIV
jgi:hypothetical protein